MRSVKLACGAILLVGLFAAVAAAQGPVPTVAVTAGKASVTPRRPGRSRPDPPLEFTRTGSGDVDRLSRHAAARSTRSTSCGRSRRSEAALATRLPRGAARRCRSAAPKRALTVDLRPNVTLRARLAGGRDRSRSRRLATTGTPNGATAPAPDATIRMVDYGFRGSTTLPRNGVIRVANAGVAYHFTAALPLRPSVSAKRVGRALRSGSERAIGRDRSPASRSPCRTSSARATINDNEITVPARGPLRARVLLRRAQPARHVPHRQGALTRPA